jgi:hypothetical protein
LIVVQRSRLEELSFAIWYQDLSAEHELPVVQEFERAMSGEFAFRCCKLQAERSLSCIATDFRIPATMSVDHVQPSNIRASRYGVLIDSKTTWVWEVRTEYAETLEDIGVVDIPGYWYLSL